MSSDDESSVAQGVAPPAMEEALRPDVRQRLVGQFEQWVDQMLAGEPPPAGLPEELLAEANDASPTFSGAARGDCDLYTLFAGLTTLSGEIRLQGRAFKQLIDALTPLSEVPEQLDRLEKLGDRQAADASGLPVSSADICDVMLDLYDRLQRGLQTCDKGIASLREPKRGWLRRWIAPTRSQQARSVQQARASAQALRDAAALTLARLESVLAEWRIERIGRIGEPFDPQRMSVVQVQPSSEFEPGTVLEVNRSGYALNGQVKATAQVTVARAE